MTQPLPYIHTLGMDTKTLLDRKKPILTITLLVLSLITAVSATHAETPGPGRFNTKLLEAKLDNFAELADHSVLAEVRNGEDTWSEAMGSRSLDEASQESEPGDRIRIGSATKSFIAAILLQLQGEGQVELDDSLGDYLPGLLPYEEDPTIRQLLTHTSGLSDFLPHLYPSLAEGDISDIREGYQNDYEPEELIAIATQDPLLFEPGTGWSYSNAGYMVLGLLIEDLTGYTLSHELERRIFEPIGLDSTYFLRSNDVGVRGPHPVPYITTGEADTPYFDTTKLSSTQLWAGGGIVSTVEDMNDFYGALTDGTLLTGEQLSEATDYVDTGRSFQYGLGLFGEQFKCSKHSGEVFLGHTGDALGHEVSSFHSMDGERQVTVAWNIGDKHGYVDPDIFDEKLNEFLDAALCNGNTKGA